MNDRHIKAIEDIIGYSFKNKALLIQAFTGPAYLNELRQSGDSQAECYQVLEFLGDSVLGCVVAKNIVDTSSRVDVHGMHSSLSEGCLSVIKSNLSDKSMLSERISELGLESYMMLGGSTKTLRLEPSVREDLFESIVGAVFIDSGRDLTAAERVVLSMLDIRKYFEKKSSKSPKTMVQEYAQARHLEWSYIDKGRSGPDDSPTYCRALLLDGVEYETAEGKSIKKAETACAALALKKLGVI